jgi:hypothetical protein
MKNIKLIFVGIVMLLVTSCKKDSKNEPDPTPTPTPEPTGTLKVFFEHKVDSFPLVFGNTYKNANGDSFTVSKFNYYISHVELIREDNSVFSESESFHLIKHSAPATNEFTVSNVPHGSYKAIRFIIGVDSVRNVSGVQSGDLSPAKSGDMFWGWTTGYIFFKLEGNSPNSGDALSHFYEYHIGGYGAPYKAQRQFDLDFKTYRANVSAAVSPKVHMIVDVNKVFNGKTKIDVSKPNYFSVTMPGPYSVEVADNYAQMIKFDHTHND